MILRADGWGSEFASEPASTAIYPENQAGSACELPGRVATHWDLHLQPNGYSPKWALFLIGPGAMAGVLLLSLLGPWLSPKQFAVDAFRSTWSRIMFLLFCLMAYLYAVILSAGAGHKMDEGRVIVGGVCAFAAMAGNLLGKVKRNFFMGIRTPWTLASERVWYETHRLAAKTVRAGGIVGLILTLLGSRAWPLLVLVASVMLPALYSLVLYKRDRSDAALR
jgi:uncharacterized membrane protein